jgi:predicted DNA-binding protein with PD1-like motif
VELQVIKRDREEDILPDVIWMGRKVYPVLVLILVGSVEVQARRRRGHSDVNTTLSDQPFCQLIDPALFFLVHFRIGCCVIRFISSLRLGWFSWESKKYEPSVTLHEQVELLSLIGDVAVKDGKPVVHAHAVIGKKDGTAHGGHLLEAHIRPTCEVILTESPIHLQKQIDPQSGLALIRL